MSDIAVQLTQPAYSVTMGSNLAVSMGGGVSVSMGGNNISTSLGANISVVFPVSIQFDIDAFLSGLIAYDNDADAITAGKSYYKASAAHESAYKGTFIIL